MTYNAKTISGMREYGESVLSNIAASDPRISGCVRVQHADGSNSVIGCAFPEKVGEWLFVFSLIDGLVLYGIDDARSWTQESEFVRTHFAHQPVAQGRKPAQPRTLAA